MIQVLVRWENNKIKQNLISGELLLGLDIEQLWSWQNFTLLGEYVKSWADAPEVNNPSFYGYYLTPSWII